MKGGTEFQRTVIRDMKLAPISLNRNNSNIWDRDLSDLRDARDDWLQIVARLRPDIHKEQAQAAMDLYARHTKIWS